MALHRIYPPCPHCGAQRDADGNPLGKKEMNGWANDGEIPVYYIKCLHCGKHFLTFVGILPITASLSALDEKLRKRLREKKRKDNGYEDTTQFRTRGPKRHDSDRIKATIQITHGSISQSLAKKQGGRRSPAFSRKHAVEIE